VLDALRDPVAGYYDPRDVFDDPAIGGARDLRRPRRSGTKGSLKGVRIGIIRESM
jgi:hypothetical protein